MRIAKEVYIKRLRFWLNNYKKFDYTNRSSN